MEKDKQALDDVDLHASRVAYTVYWGQMVAGKSTLIRILSWDTQTDIERPESGGLSTESEESVDTQAIAVIAPRNSAFIQILTPIEFFEYMPHPPFGERH